LVDNASTRPLNIDEALRNVGNSRLIMEEKLGLTYGRLAGIRNSRGEVLIFVDDDNVLAPDYIENAHRLFNRAKELGIAGGNIEPEWCDGEPEAWASELVLGFAQRDFGKAALVATKSRYQKSLPEFQPMGAGMVARRIALDSWITQAELSSFTGRRGAELTSCEDTDMVIEALHSGWSVGYFPELKLKHLIPGHRMCFDYLARLYYEHNKCWVQLLHKHGICADAPVAPWTLMPRKARAYMSCRAWAGPKQYIHWRIACGHYDGRADIYRR
jgi:glycosyltransferase involved in cell wall biosynthesis